MKNTRCINCGSPSLRRFIDLGDQPNGNHFPSESEKNSELKFPFAMSVCTECWQVQLEEFPLDGVHVLEPSVHHGGQQPVVSHFRTMSIDVFSATASSPTASCSTSARMMERSWPISGQGDAGARHRSRARTGRLCRSNGITVCETFWNSETADAIKLLNLKPDLITATAVFYHVPDLHDFIRGLRSVMSDRTVFLTQCVYMKDVIEKLQFDHFYHEHTMMHAITRRSSGLREPRDAPAGRGLLRCSRRLLRSHVGLENCVFETSETWTGRFVRRRRRGWMICDLRAFHPPGRREPERTRVLAPGSQGAGKTRLRLGAPLKGSTLLNYCGIGPDLVELATEVNQFKIGKLTPEPTFPSSRRPAWFPTGLLLAPLLEFPRFLPTEVCGFPHRRGKFIVPHPSVRIIEK